MANDLLMQMWTQTQCAVHLSQWQTIVKMTCYREWCQSGVKNIVSVDAAQDLYNEYREVRVPKLVRLKYTLQRKEKRQRSPSVSPVKANAISPLPPAPKKARVEKPLELPEYSDISDDSDVEDVPITSTEPVINQAEEDFDGSMSPHITLEEAPDARTVVRKENEVSENGENKESENCENETSENKESESSESKENESRDSENSEIKENEEAEISVTENKEEQNDGEVAGEVENTTGENSNGDMNNNQALSASVEKKVEVDHNDDSSACASDCDECIRKDRAPKPKVLERARQVVSCKDRMIRVNVGGSLFTTLTDTLKRVENSLFCKIVELIPDQTSGTLFIDRDPKFFALILHYLRRK